jgi:spore germination protein YaaH
VKNNGHSEATENCSAVTRILMNKYVGTHQIKILFKKLRSRSYRAINNYIEYLDQRSLWNLERVYESRQSDALDARKYFWLHSAYSGHRVLHAIFSTPC